MLHFPSMGPLPAQDPTLLIKSWLDLYERLRAQLTPPDNAEPTPVLQRRSGALRVLALHNPLRLRPSLPIRHHRPRFQRRNLEVYVLS